LILSTVLVGTAKIYWILLFARLLQGCSSAVVWTVGIAVLADTLPTEQLGVAMGTIGSVVALAMVSAPVVGGTIFHSFGFEAVFYTLVGFLAFDVILRLLMIERRDAKKWDIVDSESESEEGENTALLNTPVTGKSMLATVLVSGRAIF
jgi:MFS family permease